MRKVPGAIAIERATLYQKTPLHSDETYRTPQTRYIFVPGPAADGAVPDGMLERAILNAINSWDRRPEAWRWPHGVPPTRLVKAIFPSIISRQVLPIDIALEGDGT